jgi:hypothetical protein
MVCQALEPGHSLFSLGLSSGNFAFHARARLCAYAWLQSVLIEAAKLAPRWNPQLAALHAHQLERGQPNRATLQVARKLVAYLLAVDKSGQPFQVHTPPPPANTRAKNKTRRKNKQAAALLPAA